MSAIRYCGSLRIRITFIPRASFAGQHQRDVLFLYGGYRCSIVPTSKEQKWEVCVAYIPVPAAEMKPRSSSAFDHAAREALVRGRAHGWPINDYAALNDAVTRRETDHTPSGSVKAIPISQDELRVVRHSLADTIGSCTTGSSEDIFARKLYKKLSDYAGWSTSE